MGRKRFVESHKSKVFCLAFAAVISATFLSYFMFKAEASLVIVFLTTLALTPLAYLTIKIEEKFDYNGNKEKADLKHHLSLVKLFIFLFLGVTLAYIIIYLSIPPALSNQIFSLQIKTIGNEIVKTTFSSTFYSIFLNNFKILIFCLILSLFYGTGALFIIVWNASVLAVVIGDLFKQILSHNNLIMGTGMIFFKYLLHGLPEIIAYFLAGLAGGIITLAIANHHIKSKKFYYIIRDATFLILISVIFLIVAALIETLTLA